MLSQKPIKSLFALAGLSWVFYILQMRLPTDGLHYRWFTPANFKMSWPLSVSGLQAFEGMSHILAHLLPPTAPGRVLWTK